MNVTKKNSLKAEILVVDDTPANLGLLFNILSKNGYKIRPVTNGNSALEVALVSPPDLILLDILMPDISGYEVCQKLKANPITREIPVIFLSALSEGLDKARAFQVGGADYVTKPFQVQEVLARVNNQLMIWTQKQQLQREILHRRQTETALRLQYQREQALNRVLQAIHNSIDLSTIFSTAVAAIGNLLEAQWVGIVQSLPDEKTWKLLAEYSSTSPLITARLKEASIGENLFSIQPSDLEKSFLNEPSQLINNFNLNLVQHYFKIYLPIPIQVETQVVWGSLCLIRHQSIPWTESDIQLAKVVTAQLAIAIQQSQLYQQLQQANQQLECLANLDGLTQVANRRRFDQVLQQEWYRLQREQQPLSLILCDIDDFKSYNDTYGHQAGDSCLQKVANAISVCTKRVADLVARYGGEEFAILLVNTPISGAVQVAGLIRTQVQQLQLPHIKSRIGDFVTLSLGVSSLVPAPESSPGELVRMADKALYQAKKQGRNCIVTS